MWIQREIELDARPRSPRIGINSRARSVSS
jgi:hypothetical protein